MDLTCPHCGGHLELRPKDSKPRSDRALKKEARDTALALLGGPQKIADVVAKNGS